ncbi:hypothetical protein SAMN05444354_108310 [Stigmatella aurantiaca]|uniref:Uncharacterized protein n=1 Tax=Stigmatella aurantiaca TaxID=41 RepID=A0A1H7T7X1_STIAU|nr:hypothetical protein SAMN05444354_108310 [Stigmatella aurantiaca]
MRKARGPAAGHVAGRPGWARRMLSTTSLNTFHPGLAGLTCYIEHLAFTPLRTGRLLAMGAIRLDTSRNTLGIPDALLRAGTALCLAARETHGLGRDIRAEKPFWTARGLLRMTGAPTPPLCACADQLPSTCILFAAGRPEAFLTLFAHPHGDAIADQRAFLQGGQVLAGLAFRALSIREALTVDAVARPGTLIPQAPQGNLAIRTALAFALIGHQTPARLDAQHGTDRPSIWSGRSGSHLQDFTPEKEQRHAQQRADECCECCLSACHSLQCLKHSLLFSSLSQYNSAPGPA